MSFIETDEQKELRKAVAQFSANYGEKYYLEKARAGDSWRHTKVTLKPTNPAYAPIVLEDAEEDAVQVIAEFVEILGTDAPERS